MGKTRTAFIAETPDEKTSGKTKYEEKRRKQKEQRDKEALKKKQVGKVGLKGGERIKVVGADITDALQKEPSGAKAMKGKKLRRGNSPYATHPLTKVRGSLALVQLSPTLALLVLRSIYISSDQSPCSVMMRYIAVSLPSTQRRQRNDGFTLKKINSDLYARLNGD